MKKYIQQSIYFIFLLIFMLVLSACLSTDDKVNKKNRNTHIIVLKNGKEYKGNLIQINDKTVFFEINGSSTEFNKSEITRIQFHKNRLYEDVETINEIKDKEIISIWNASKKYQPDNNSQVVILLDQTNYEFTGNNLVTVKIKKAFKILNEEGKEYSTQYFYYLKNISSAELSYGITISKNGTITPVEESAINDEPINNNIPHYDILQRKKFGFKNVDIGSVLIWEAKIIKQYDPINNPFLINKNLVSYNNIEKQITSITYPDDMKLNYSIYQGLIPYKKPVIKKQKKGKNIVLSFTQSNINGYVETEKNTPSSSIIYPKLYVSPYYRLEDITKLYYESYFNKPVSQKIKFKAEKIAGKGKIETKLDNLYNYINYQVNLANILMKEASYTPIIEDKLVDFNDLNTLDKSYLFIRMAQSIGIPVKMYLYRNNYKNKIDTECFSLKNFDSVICIAEIDKTSKYFSFESKNLGPGQTYYTINNAYALELTSISTDFINLKTIPYDFNKYEYNYNCTLNEDNSMNIIKTTTIYGQNEIPWRSIRFLSKEELDKYMKSRINSFGNNVKLINYKFINDLNDFTKPIVIKENIFIGNFSYSSGKNIKLFKLPELKYSAGSVSKNNRELPYDIDNTYISKYNFNINYNSKYKPGYLPGDIDISYNDYSFTGKYSIKENSLNIQLLTIFKQDLIPASDYNNLKNFYEQRAKLTNEWILLESREQNQ